MAEDRELLTQFVRDGSRSALSAIVDRYRQMVYAVCIRELGDADDAADATQATFILLQNSAHKIKRRERLSAWLFSAARHVCQNARRERIRRAKVEGTALVDDLPVSSFVAAEGPDPNRVLAYLQRLSDKDRLALSLRYLNGMSVKEVGASLGVTEQAAQMRLSRALERFRGVLQSAGLSMAMINLDRVLSNQLPWDAPEIRIAPKSEHRWATRMMPNPGKVLLKVGVFGFAGLVGFIFVAPVLLMMAFGQVSFSPQGAWQVWHMMAAGISGADRATVHAGRWVSAEDFAGPEGQKNLQQVEVFRSANNEHIQVSLAPLSAPKQSSPNQRLISISIDKIGDQWRLNGIPATSTGAQGFQWDRGDWTLLANSDRSAEQVTFHAEGLKLKITHLRGGSVRSLKVSEDLDVVRAADSTYSFTDS